LTTSVGLQGLFPRLPTPTTSNALPVPGTAWSFTLPSVSFTEALPGTRTSPLAAARADGPDGDVAAEVAVFAAAGVPRINAIDAASEVTNPILSVCCTFGRVPFRAGSPRQRLMLRGPGCAQQLT
jgi:hypothetical protein